MGNFLLPIGASVITKLGQLRFITNWGKRYYKLGQLFLLQIGASVITNSGSLIITNQGSYFKLGQPLLQIGAAITNWGNYYKLGHNNMHQPTSQLYGIWMSVPKFLYR